MRYENIALKTSCIIIILFIFAAFWSGEKFVFADEAVIEKYFNEMTQEEKDRVLGNLISEEIVPNTIKAKGKTYSLNITNWNELGVITYGSVAIVNAENQNTSHPNYKDGQWRYLGYDMNGGLYGNDNFPPDYTGGGPPQNKDWLSIGEIKNSPSARSLVGNSTIIASDNISMVDKIETASVFLSENRAWVNKGWTDNGIAEYFLFNAVVSNNGLTQGQFIGVHDVGEGTFRYQTFSVQIKVKFEVPPAIPIEPDPNQDPPDPEVPIVVPPEPGSDVTVNCVLGLPPVTYTGHPTLAQDYSVYDVDGEVYSAQRAYYEGIASNRFSTGSGIVSRITGSSTRANAVFNDPGCYEVKLTVMPKNGSSAFDVQTIEVKPTPTIMHNLTGTQKQNRKQVINVSVAKDPSTCLTDFWVKIERLDTLESVILHNELGSGANTFSNSETIMTRPIFRNPDSDQFYEHCKLEFLLKNSEPADCRYTIFVKDSFGNVDQVAENFLVVPDLPPEANVFLEGAYIRNRDSNVAEIIAEDISLTDGDQIERVWFYRSITTDQPEKNNEPWIKIDSNLRGYTDYTFGIGKKIGFPKEGVGLFEVRLIAKDLWSEETLPEYVAESDRFVGEVISISEVVNIAPVVSLDPLSAMTADITILAGGQAEYDLIKGKQAQLEIDLLQQGVDPHITIDKMLPSATDKDTGAYRTLEVETPFGYQGNWLFYESDNYIVDDEHLYKVDATWTGSDVDDYPQFPYTISCWRFDAAGSEDTKWTYTFSDSVMSVPLLRSGPYLAQDDSGEYLYFAAGGKTLVVSKDNGSHLAVLDIEVGNNNYIEGGNIYTLKKDGIYSISRTTGETIKIYENSIIDGKYRRIGGLVNFITHSDGSLARGYFDPATQSISIKPLNFTDIEGIHDYELLGIDAEGKLIINDIFRGRGSTGDPSSNYGIRTHVFGIDNELIFTAVGPTDSTVLPGIAIPIYDEGGMCNYIAYTNRDSGSNKYVTARLYGIYDGFFKTESIKGGSSYPSIFSKIPFARQIGEEVYICTGAEWVYVYPTGFGVYPERTKTFAFNPHEDTVRTGNLHQEVGIGLNTIEYGCASDVLTAVQVGYNQLVSGYSLNYVIKWNQTLDQIIGRYLHKYLRKDKDINALIIYDETNSDELYTVSLKQKINEFVEAKDGMFTFVTDEVLNNSNGLIDIIFPSQGEIRKKTLEVLVEDESGGRLSKSYSLKQGKTYYYEYETKNIAGEPEDWIEIDHASKYTQHAQFGDSKYAVADSHFEDFNSADSINHFFSLDPTVISEGFYKGATVKERSGSYISDPYPTDKTAIRFSVPEGGSALLYFDYLIEVEREGYWMQSYVKIDGMLWNKHISSADLSGHYCHPVLLQPGEHEITFFASGTDSWGEPSGKMWLRDLHVDILETNAGETIDTIHETLAVEDVGDGYSQVKGIFELPPQVLCYDKVLNSEIINVTADSPPYTTLISNTRLNKIFDLTIPPDKVAFYTQIPTVSTPQYSGGKSYPINYMFNNFRWTCLAKPNNEQLVSNIPNDYIINPGVLTGTQRFTIGVDTRNSAYGDILNVFSVLVDSENLGWEDLNFFIAECNGEDTLYLQSEQYKDTTISLTFPEGQYSVKDLKIYYIEKGIKVYLEEDPLLDSARLSKWQLVDAAAAIVHEMILPEVEDVKLIYKKGDLVSYNINYFDYEGDPSKKQYWKYTHTPFNDGAHPDAAVILNDNNESINITGKVLNTPIQRFYIDGKYTVEHWQEDNTSRPIVPLGNPDYDKLSNVEAVTFYIQGGGTIPWIKSIKTVPSPVNEGDNFRMRIEIDDAEKDPLQLITEVYYEKELIYKHRKENIAANASGIYPVTETDFIPFPATPGVYEAVCTVSDDTGVGIDSYRFAVTSAEKITGRVYHTSEWEKNRKKYNMHYFGTEFNEEIAFDKYINLKIPRKRGTNVFWSGERYMVDAHVIGKPVKVTAEIRNFPSYSMELTYTGDKNPHEESIYRGELWHRTMLSRWGRKNPEQLDFIFRAEYISGATKTYEAQIIVDSNTDYWLLHRLW